jgi:peptide/nickel transport system permease protein
MKNEFLRHPLGLISGLVLVLLYAAALFAPVIAPYPAAQQDLKKTYHPPTRLVWQDGGLEARVYKLKDPTVAAYEETRDAVPIHFFVKGWEYKIFWKIPCRWHLFGVDDPNQRVYLLGSDATGRDVFSRLMLGSQVSMTIGLVGASVTLILGLVIGGFAGYFGGWIDNVVMRFTELLMAIPGLYLLLALRSAFAQRFDSSQMFLLIVFILSFIGWSGTARVVRGMCLSFRQMPFVLAAEAMGQRPFWILLRHLLPNTFSYLVVSATLSIPGYILGEASLSFLNIGIQEPDASWGLMLAQAQDIKIFMLDFWWLLTPGIAILITVMAFNMLGDALRDWVDPKHQHLN